MAVIGSTVEIRFAKADDSVLAELAPAEWRAKAAAMRFEKDARMELVAGGLLATMLAERGVARPRFTVNRFGKPMLDGADGIHFNLAHSENMVMCVVAGHPIGCDLERMVIEPERDRAFYERWTRREAGLKMLGCGFADGAGFNDPPHPEAKNVPSPDGFMAAVCP